MVPATSITSADVNEASTLTLLIKVVQNWNEKLKITSMSPGCYFGVAGAGLWESKPTPRPKFSITMWSHPQPVGGGLNLPNRCPRQIEHCTLRLAKRAYNGGLGQCPQCGPGAPGAQPLVGGSGAKPSWSCKLLSIWASKRDSKFVKFSVLCKLSRTDECRYDTLHRCCTE